MCLVNSYGAGGFELQLNCSGLLFNPNYSLIYLYAVPGKTFMLFSCGVSDAFTVYLKETQTFLFK